MIKTKEKIEKQSEIENKIFEIKKSYVSKAEFIEIINNIEFESIKKCELELITWIIADFETGEVKPLTKNIEID